MRVVSEGVFFDFVSDRFLKSAHLRIHTGCGVGCAICSRPLVEGTEVRCTSMEELKEGLVALWSQGVLHLNFLDDHFLLQGDELARLLGELEAEGVSFAFSLRSPVKLLLRSQKHLMPLKKLGLRQITLGVFNANQDVLQRYQEQCTPGDQQYAIQIIQALRIQLQIRYVMFEPQTTLAHLRNDLQFFEANHILGLVPFTDLLTSYLDLDVDTPIWREYQERGWIQPSIDVDLPYEIFDPDAEGVFRWMLFFETEFGIQWNRYYERLLFLRVELAEEKPNWIVTNAGQELMYITLSLRMIPYDLFKALLTCAAQKQIHQVTGAEMRRQVEQSFKELEDTYQSFCQTHGLKAREIQSRGRRLL